MKLSKEDIFYNNFISKESKVKVKNLIERNGIIYLLAKKSDFGKLIGKNGIKIKKMKEKLGKKIIILEKGNTAKEFIKKNLKDINLKETREKVDKERRKFIVMRIEKKDQLKTRKTLNNIKPVLKELFGIKKIIVK